MKPYDEDAFYEALAARGTGVGDGASPADLELIEAALAADAAALATMTGSASRRWFAAVAAVAAVALLWALWPSFARTGAAHGTWIAQQGGQRFVDAPSLPLGMWLVAQNEACATVAQATVCASEGTVLRVTVPDRGPPHMEVERGSVSVPEASGSWVITTSNHQGLLRAGESAVVDAPPVLAAEATEPGPVPSPSGPVPGVEPEVQDPLPPDPPAPVPAEKRSPNSSHARQGDAKSMLAAARALRGRGEAGQADAAYAELVVRFPGSAEANAARVSLGQLRLQAGRFKSALTLFDRYLDHGGPLAQEALWGKVQALHALGRDTALRQAVDDLQDRFPRSVYLDQAKERLE